MLQIIKNDPWLKPYEKEIVKRHDAFLKKEKELTENGKITLSDFASGYLYFGLHKTNEGWVLREWAPNATEIFLIGTFNSWQRMESFRFTKLQNGVWELKIPLNRMQHHDLYKLLGCWDGGMDERIPAWCRRVVQDEKTHIFSAQVWDPEQPYFFKIDILFIQSAVFLA